MKYFILALFNLFTVILSADYLYYSSSCNKIVNGECIFIEPTKSTLNNWFEAREYCKTVYHPASDLVSIHGVFQNQEIIDLLEAELVGKREAWIGFQSFRTPGIFEWVDRGSSGLQYWKDGFPTDFIDSRCAKFRTLLWESFNCNLGGPVTLCSVLINDTLNNNTIPSNLYKNIDYPQVTCNPDEKDCPDEYSHCNDVHKDAATVCSGHGSCEFNTTTYSMGCKCDEKYYEPKDCGWSCFGIDEKLTGSACNGNGLCTDQDTCECGSPEEGIVYTKDCYAESKLVNALKSGGVVAAIVILILLLIGTVGAVVGVVFYNYFKIKKYKEEYKKIQQVIEEEVELTDLHLKNYSYDKEIFNLKFDEIGILQEIHDEDIGADIRSYKVLVKDNLGVFRLFKTSTLKSGQNDLGEFETWIKEVTAVSHYYLIGYLGSTYDIEKFSFGYVLEYAKNGSCFQYISKINENRSPDLSPYGKINLLYEMIQGMSYAHDNNIIIVNLNLNSIYLDKLMDVKIDHVSLFRYYRERRGVLYLDSNNAGKSFWLAPEIIKALDYTKACDVYSFAIASAQILTNNLSPFDGIKGNIEILISNDPNMRPALENIEDEWIKTMLSKCWDENPSKRPTMTELKETVKEKVEKIREDNKEGEGKELPANISDITSKRESKKIDGESEDFKLILIKEEDIKFEEMVEDKTISEENQIFTGEWNGKFKVYVQKFEKKLFPEFEQFENEINKVCKLKKDSTNIASFIGFSFLPKINVVTKKYHQTLHSWILSGEKDIKEKTKIIFTLAKAIQCCHKNSYRIIDLSIYNILLTENHETKLIFNFANSSKKSYQKSFYIAPEIIKKEILTKAVEELKIDDESETEENYLMKCDVFSFSIICYVILSSKIKPFDIDENILKIGNEMANNSSIRPSLADCKDWPNYLVNLMRMCWQENPTMRPSFDQITMIIENVFEM